MTHRDTTMLERLTEVARKFEYRPRTAGDEDDHLEFLARAILNELKQVDEGMVKAGRNWLAQCRYTLNSDKARSTFEVMIDHVLREGEGK